MDFSNIFIREIYLFSPRRRAKILKRGPIFQGDMARLGQLEGQRISQDYIFR